MRVLVVEDEQLLADAVATGLRREAMAVDVVYDGAAALERIEVNDYDVVVLDRDLPWCTATTSAVASSSSACRPECSCSPHPGTSATVWRAWSSAPTTICPSRSPSAS